MISHVVTETNLAHTHTHAHAHTHTHLKSAHHLLPKSHHHSPPSSPNLPAFSVTSLTHHISSIRLDLMKSCDGKQITLRRQSTSTGAGQELQQQSHKFCLSISMCATLLCWFALGTCLFSTSFWCFPHIDVTWTGHPRHMNGCPSICVHFFTFIFLSFN